MAEVLPSSDRLEQTVLGIALLEPECATEISTLAEVDFYTPRHSTILRAIQCLVAAGQPTDVLTTIRQLEKMGHAQACGGFDYLVGLANGAGLTTYLDQHIKDLRELSTARRIALAARRLESEAASGKHSAQALCDLALKEILAVAQVSARSDPRSVFEVTRDILEELSEAPTRLARPKYKTGFDTLDAMLSPLEGGQLILVAARPSAGKTSFALHLAERIARAGAQTLFFSLETTTHKLVKRTLAQLSSVELGKITGGTLKQEELDAVVQTAGGLVHLPLYVDDSYSLTVSRLRAVCRRHVAHYGSLGAVLIDYVQLLKPDQRSDSREREVSEISVGLKALAKEFDIPVIALSQLNRESEKSGEVNNGQLRSSGQLEQDADVILLMRRSTPPDAKEIRVEVRISKQKDGPTGLVELAFEGPFVRFADLESDEQETPEPRQYRNAPVVRPHQEPAED